DLCEKISDRDRLSFREDDPLEHAVDAGPDDRGLERGHGAQGLDVDRHVTRDDVGEPHRNRPLGALPWLSRACGESPPPDRNRAHEQGDADEDHECSAHGPSLETWRSECRGRSVKKSEAEARGARPFLTPGPRRPRYLEPVGRDLRILVVDDDAELAALL